jgi:hypothetical protein
MEKVKLDTEIRKLDMLRAAHINQQYEISDQIRGAPGKIEDSRSYHARLCEDIATRDAGGEKFSMTVEGRKFTGKNAREEAATALIEAVMAAKGDPSLVVRGQYKGLDILSNGNKLGEEYLPGLYLRGKNTYTIGLNPDSALGTLASMEHVLRRLDRLAEEEQSRCERMEKALADYQEQLGRPFEHEERLRALLVKQQEINKKLDLDKGDIQVAAEFVPQVSVFDQEREERRPGGGPAHKATCLVEPGKREAGGSGQAEQKMDTQADLATVRGYMERRQQPGIQAEQEENGSLAATIKTRLNGNEQTEKQANEETHQQVAPETGAALAQSPGDQVNRQTATETQQSNTALGVPSPAQDDQAGAFASQVESRLEEQQFRSVHLQEDCGLAAETIALFSNPMPLKVLFACQVGESGPPSRIVITERSRDAMSYYQLCGNKPGLYIALDGELSDQKKTMLRSVLSGNSQAKIITATDADCDGEKCAVFVSSVRSDSVRARPGLNNRRDVKYESWQDVLMDRPMQPVAASSLRQQSEQRGPAFAHDITPNVTPMNWRGKGRSTVPPSDQTS